MVTKLLSLVLVSLTFDPLGKFLVGWITVRDQQMSVFSAEFHQLLESFLPLASLILAESHHGVATGSSCTSGVRVANNAGGHGGRSGQLWLFLVWTLLFWAVVLAEINGRDIGKDVIVPIVMLEGIFGERMMSGSAGRALHKQVVVVVVRMALGSIPHHVASNHGSQDGLFKIKRLVFQISREEIRERVHGDTGSWSLLHVHGLLHVLLLLRQLELRHELVMLLVHLLLPNGHLPVRTDRSRFEERKVNGRGGSCLVSSSRSGRYLFCCI
mmetsp:Transcript_20786/g.36538  ORF Transcript_20786/g.36538 Transcript_20786/m.36538 type:complete len:270 (-) Transcript_20786:323-1132(-)